MASAEILFKATLEEAEIFCEKLFIRFPEMAFQIFQVSYPTYNRIHCFEVRVERGGHEEAIKNFITENFFISPIPAHKV